MPHPLRPHLPPPPSLRAQPQYLTTAKLDEVMMMMMAFMDGPTWVRGVGRVHPVVSLQLQLGMNCTLWCRCCSHGGRGGWAWGACSMVGLMHLGHGCMGEGWALRAPCEAQSCALLGPLFLSTACCAPSACRRQHGDELLACGS